MSAAGDPGPKSVRRRAVALLWLSAALFAAGVSPYWRISPDSALYTGMARAIAAGEGYAFSGRVQSSIPPVTPVSLALVYKAAHAVSPGLSFIETFVCFNAVTALFAMAGAVAAFLLALELSTPRRALLALLLLVTSSRYFSYGIEPLTDVPYCFFSWAALAFLSSAEKSGRSFTWAGAAVGLALAVLTRLVGLALVFSATVYFLLKLLRNRDGRRGAPAGLLAALPAAAAGIVLLALMMYARGQGAFNYVDDLAEGRGLAGMALSAAANFSAIPAYLFEAVTGLESLGGVCLVLALVIAAGAVVAWRKGTRLPVIYSCAYLAFVALAYPPVPRYFVPMLPLVYLFLFEGSGATARLLSRFTASQKWRRAGRRTATVLLSVTVAVNLVFAGREIALNFSKDFYATYKHGKYRDYFLLARALTTEPPEGAVMAREARIIHALSGVNTVSPPAIGARPLSVEVLRTFIADAGVTAIVIDPAYENSAEAFEKIVADSPSWVETVDYRGLVLYESPRREAPGSAAE